MQTKKDVYKEQLKININAENLINHHTFIVFEKENELDNMHFSMESIKKPFDKIM